MLKCCATNLWNLDSCETVHYVGGKVELMNFEHFPNFAQKGKFSNLLRWLIYLIDHVLDNLFEGELSLLKIKPDVSEYK